MGIFCSWNLVPLFDDVWKLVVVVPGPCPVNSSTLEQNDDGPNPRPYCWSMYMRFGTSPNKTPPPHPSSLADPTIYLSIHLSSDCPSGSSSWPLFNPILLMFTALSRFPNFSFWLLCLQILAGIWCSKHPSSSYQQQISCAVKFDRIGSTTTQKARICNIRPALFIDFCSF